MSREQLAVAAQGLGKRFGRTRALEGLDLAIPAGTVHGLLGPNGAGKTTAVRVLATLAAPDTGWAKVAGFDVVKEAAQVRRSIGLAGQHAAVDEGITGRDNLRLVGRFHHLGVREARRRADDLLERFGLTAAGDRLVRDYSGGMRRRLDLVACLVIRPPVLFLDEPTTGLDPRSRGEIWDAVRELAASGSTVLLTTQYLDEADRLADTVMVLDHGRAIADGPPGRLKAAIGTRVHVVVEEAGQLHRAAAVLAAMTGGTPHAVPSRLEIEVISRPGCEVLLPALVRELDAAGVTARDVSLRSPSLDDAFLALTADRQAA
ncbi:ABC-2 type transport system ATP-binding protein [Kitasatospora sp. MAP12-15]|uniref:ATP-binding cassette domain-containing protein n=1 Tax=unclassified Kitasatospora TaxID=2633591 RepID=UPI00247451F7|nr:ATP-binding cassette domain-containing protein [Kitasatospora sp. MAP12-44]MDH6114310.1 ABC-2 type transport system ATP-binding protein [Kitasatospora sp. MAP12-44]